MEHARRMYDEALRRINDADLLSQSLRAQSDSSAFLRILGFEVLLKTAVLLSGTPPRRTHSYENIWGQLPATDRSEILKAAGGRMTGHADLSDVVRLLRAYQYVFEQGRYFYELYEGWTLEQQREIGEYWESIGAPIEEADVKYYPLELICLIEGLKAYIQKRIP